MIGGCKLLATAEVIASKQRNNNFQFFAFFCLLLQLDYDNNRKRTRVIPKSLDPTWNEKFEFPIPDPSMPGDLEINVQNERRSGTGRRSSFLGKVVIPVILAPNFPSDVRWYPLQKRGLFSNIKGDIG
jgi:hypothetical protein